MKTTMEMKLFKTFILFFVGVVESTNFWESDDVKYGPATNIGEVMIHSRHGHYISIGNNGDVKAVWNPKTPGGMFSF